MPRNYQKSTRHGVGWDALAASVVLSAVRDVVKAPRPHDRADARAFLESSACDHILDLLGMPSNVELLDRLRRGVSDELIDRIGGASADPDAWSEYQRKYRQRRRNIEFPTSMLVLC